MVENWLEVTIARGLQGLLALRLPGAPAEDSVNITLDVWLIALHNYGKWEQADDQWRIEKAFAALYASTERWPVPKQLLSQLPKRKESPALPAPKISQEQRLRNQQRIQEFLQQLRGKRDVKKSID